MNDHTTLIRMAYETPWAILDSKLAEITQFLEMRSGVGGVESTKDRSGFFNLPAGVVFEKMEPQKVRLFGSTAIISLQGTIFPKANMMTDMSGGTSASIFSREVTAAVKDKKVQSIVLDVDSPGGSVLGIAEAAETVRRARDFKPVTAAVNGIGASAAYWIASQASRIELTPSGGVGSIGVRMIHRDISKALDAKGVKVTVLSAGKHKADGNPYEPLTEQAKEHFEGEMDKIHTKFIQAVARGRGISEDTVRQGFGQGAMVQADDALEMGMIDEVSNFDETLHGVESLNVAAGRRGQISTRREYERFLRDAGFSRTEAKRLAPSYDGLQRDAGNWTDVAAVIDKYFQRCLEE